MPSAMSSVAFHCTCGSTAGDIRVGRNTGTHTRCHCVLCNRAMSHYSGPRTRAEGVELFQTTPDKISMLQGADNLVAVKVSPNDMIRWVAGCCDTLLFITPVDVRSSLVGIVLENVDDMEPFGPVVADSYVGTGDEKGRHQKGWRIASGLVRRGLRARLNGTWKDTIFFDPDTGVPAVEPVLLPRSIRR